MLSLFRTRFILGIFSHVAMGWSLGSGVTSSAPHLGSWTPQLTPALPWAVNTTIALAYTGTQTGASKPTATVVVGSSGKLEFYPSSLNASVGTVVAFNFLGINHTLTQSDLHNPCQKNGTLDTGFKQFNPTNVSGRFIVELEVKSQDPQWFFCAQELNRSHCEAGMVFALNPRGRFEEFLHNALSSAPVASTTSELACHLPTTTLGNASATLTETGMLRPANNSSSVSPSISNAAASQVVMSLSLGIVALVLLL